MNVSKPLHQTGKYLEKNLLLHITRFLCTNQTATGQQQRRTFKNET